MKTRIYMTEHIRETTPTGPVIAIRRGRQQRYGNAVELVDPNGNTIARVVYRPRGLRGAPHHVRAWVETDLFVRIK